MIPIVYRATVDVRFADLDPYGHVNSSHYLDYVVSSRWRFTRERFGLTEKTFEERRTGFYLTRAETRFRKPIVGTGAILVTSRAEGAPGLRVTISYEIRSLDEAELHANGQLDMVTMNLDTARLVSCPEWVRDILFEPAPVGGT